MRSTRWVAPVSLAVSLGAVAFWWWGPFRSSPVRRLLRSLEGRELNLAPIIDVGDAYLQKETADAIVDILHAQPDAVPEIISYLPDTYLRADSTWRLGILALGKAGTQEARDFLVSVCTEPFFDLWRRDALLPLAMSGDPRTLAIADQWSRSDHPIRGPFLWSSAARAVVVLGDRKGVAIIDRCLLATARDSEHIPTGDRPVRAQPIDADLADTEIARQRAMMADESDLRRWVAVMETDQHDPQWIAVLVAPHLPKDRGKEILQAAVKHAPKDVAAAASRLLGEIGTQPSEP